jgi:hypothetical protein
MDLQREFSRLIIKRSTTTGEVPTIPASSELDETWLSTDIYKGEIFINLADDRIFYRSENGIVELSALPTAEVSTTDATPTDLVTIEIPDDSMYRIEWNILAMETDSSTGYSNKYTVTYRADAGSLTKVGTTDDIHDEFTTAGVTESTSGNDLTLAVTGEAATNIDWKVQTQIFRIDV